MPKIIGVTTITNSEAATTTTMEEVQAWMTSKSIAITGSISLSIDDMGYVKELVTAVTLTAAQITDFKNTFFNKRSQGNKGASVTSSSTLTLGNGNLFPVTGTTTINYITTTGWKEGSMICLDFHSNITINHNSGSPASTALPIFLNNNSLFSFKPGSVLTLIYDENYWREIARMETSP